MKIKRFLFAAVALLAFGACSETPESPFNPGGNGNNTGGNGGATINGNPYIDEPLTTSLGGFKTQQEVGNFAWKHEIYQGNGYAKASGYANGASQNATSWLISPSFDLSNETKAYVSFDYVINKGEQSAAATNHKLMITSEFTGDVTTTEWTEIDFKAVNNNNWTFHNTGNVELPIDFIGAENVVIALKYISTTETSSTWEVNNVKVVGEVGADEEYNPEINNPVIEGENLLQNSSFETWQGNNPQGWGLTVSNSTYSKSTEAHTGESAIIIEGTTTGNKRLASGSYTLKAGTYTLAAYLKSTGEATGQFRLGYAKLTNGVVADSQNDYIYITSASDVPSSWAQKYESFTLEAETEVAIIIMNSKYGNGASILVDDVTLTTTDGGVVEGTGSEEPETPETPEGTYVYEALTSTLGTFTTQETVGNYPWGIAAIYQCAKVTGYSGSANEAESWMVSKSFDLSKETAAYISFDYVIAYNSDDINECHKVVFSNDYTGDVATATWKEINYSPTKSGVWTLENTGKIAIPEEMYGKENVVVAFKYTSSASNASTWEVANVVVASGAGETPSTPETPEPEEPETPDTPDTPEAEASVFDFTNPEALTPAYNRAEVPAGSTSGVGTDITDGETFTNGNLSIKFENGSATTNTRFWTKTGGDVEIRAYKGSTITVSVSEGTMSNIVFTGGKVSTMTADCGSFNAGTWSGDASSVTFTVSGTLNIQKITVK